jgi:methylmalonyl-CoA mutase
VTGDRSLPLNVYNEIKARTHVRGTVQADILKEDQAQNTCIFSTEFALRLMVMYRNISSKKCNGTLFGFNIRVSYVEAGTNPLHTFHISNGFTLCEYYLSRGMSINDFGPNLSFFSRMELIRVCGYRSCSEIWAKAMKK